MLAVDLTYVGHEKRIFATRRARVVVNPVDSVTESSGDQRLAVQAAADGRCLDASGCIDSHRQRSDGVGRRTGVIGLDTAGNQGRGTHSIGLDFGHRRKVARCLSELQTGDGGRAQELCEVLSSVGGGDSDSDSEQGR
jgi:hypothetical protein